MTAVAVRPNTSGSYISSACAGAVRNVPGGRRADDVGEVVAAFAQARGEQLHAIVVALDVIEAAALPPGEPVVVAVVRSRVLFAATSARRGRREPRLDRLEARGQRIGDGDEAALLREAQRQRDPDEIAGLERRRRRPGAGLDVRRVGALDADALVEPCLEQLIDRVAQPRRVEQRARARRA